MKRLNPNDLKIFTTTNFNLSELYKLKTFSYNTKFTEEHTYNNLTVIENITQPIENESSILEQFTIVLPNAAKVIHDQTESFEKLTTADEAELEPVEVLLR